ncbi:hypothetical protein [Caulobacter sp.]|uniref:hypothetical protein n=1 Tax=Caulobacter sp. TaxID=78 RepID=UPI003BAEA349
MTAQSLLAGLSTEEKQDIIIAAITALAAEETLAALLAKLKGFSVADPGFVIQVDNDGVPIDPSAPVPVYSARSTYVDRSGVIAVGGTAQPAVAAGLITRGAVFQNRSPLYLYLHVGGLASASVAANAGSLEVPPGGIVNFTTPPDGELSVYGALTGQAFTLWTC